MVRKPAREQGNVDATIDAYALERYAIHDTDGWMDGWMDILIGVGFDSHAPWPGAKGYRIRGHVTVLVYFVLITTTT